MTARQRVSYTSMYVDYAQIIKAFTLAKLLIAAKRGQMAIEVILLTQTLKNLPCLSTSIKTTLSILTKNYLTMIWAFSSHVAPQTPVWKEGKVRRVTIISARKMRRFQVSSCAEPESENIPQVNSNQHPT